MKVKRNRKVIYQYGLDGTFIKEYDSVTSASRETGISTGSLVRSVDTSWQAGGFQWRYAFYTSISPYVKKMKTPRKIEIGNVYHSEKYGNYKVVRFSHQDSSRRNHFYIVFEETGYECAFNSTAILDKTVVDYMYPSFHGVGFLGGRTNQGRDFTVWQSMIKRCYGDHESSHLYRNVTVCERWHNFQNFKDDYKLIDGYEESKFKRGKLVLDKDLKQLGTVNKIYSLDTCTFITAEKNFDIRDRTSEMKAYIKVDAIHEDGTKHVEKTISEMANITGFSKSAIRNNTEDGSTYTREPWSIVRQ